MIENSSFFHTLWKVKSMIFEKKKKIDFGAFFVKKNGIFCNFSWNQLGYTKNILGFFFAKMVKTFLNKKGVFCNFFVKSIYNILNLGFFLCENGENNFEQRSILHFFVKSIIVTTFWGFFLRAKSIILALLLTLPKQLGLYLWKPNAL